MGVVKAALNPVCVWGGVKDAGEVERQAGVQGQPLAVDRNRGVLETASIAHPSLTRAAGGTGVSILQGRHLGTRGVLALSEAFLKTLWGSL